MDMLAQAMDTVQRTNASKTESKSEGRKTSVRNNHGGKTDEDIQPNHRSVRNNHTRLPCIRICALGNESRQLESASTFRPNHHMVFFNHTRWFDSWIYVRSEEPMISTYLARITNGRILIQMSRLRLGCNGSGLYARFNGA